MAEKNRTTLQLEEGLENPDLFTMNEWEIVTYIKNNRERIVHMNIGEVAQETYFSNGTILRVCRKLGCEGFKDLKQKLLLSNENRKYFSKDVDFSVPFKTGESVSEIIQDISSLYRNGLNAIQEVLDPVVLQKMARSIINSNKFVMYAVGDSQITSEGFMNKLIKLGILGTVATARSEQMPISLNLHAGDCALFVSYSGSNENINPALPVLKQNGVRIIGITAARNSAVDKMSDLTVVIPQLEGDRDEKIATFYSQFAFSYLLDILYALIYDEVQKTKR